MPIEADSPLLNLKTRILNPDTFHSASFGGRRKGHQPAWETVSVRPVLLKDDYHLQVSYFDGRQTDTRNYRPAQAEPMLDALFEQGFNNIQVRSQDVSLRAQITKRGKVILHRESPPAEPPNLRHNRPKDRLLASDEPLQFLQDLGIMTAEGKIRAKMRAKFKQINEFLTLLDQTTGLDSLPTDRPLRVVDCGCGSAALTFAAYHYLTDLRGLAVEMLGVDLKQKLIEERNRQAEQLGWDGLVCQTSTIIDFEPPAPPDVVLALHACDTATDEALAQAIRWGSGFILSVPCCHHHLQAQLAGVANSPAAQKPLFRHGILKERLGDILTDASRALILRILGYQTEVIEFISSEHTAKNLMIRAIKTPTDPATQSQFRREYHALKQEWQVTPYLETLLGEAYASQLNASVY